LGETQFLALPNKFQGRATRGTEDLNLTGIHQVLGVWMEPSFDPLEMEKSGEMSLSFEVKMKLFLSTYLMATMILKTDGPVKLVALLTAMMLADLPLSSLRILSLMLYSGILTSAKQIYPSLLVG
jgi:hypothetical protein